MEERSELRHDLHELRSLRAMSSRKVVKCMLDEKIAEIEGKIKALEASNTVNGSGDVPVLKQSRTEAVSSSAVPLATVKITNYDFSHSKYNKIPVSRISVVINTFSAWDQSDKYVKLYLTIPDIHTIPQERIAVSFSESQVEVNARDVSSKNYSLTIKGLLKTINPSSSSFKVEEENWKYLTKAEMQSKEKSTPKFDQKSDPQESLMNLMKQMYDEGDDDMKRTIRKAWHESQTKKSLEPDESM